MNTHEYQEAIQNVIYLARCAINGEIPDKRRVKDMNLENLCQAANRHMLAGITAMALESAGIRDKTFTQAKGKAIRKVVMFDAERASVLQALEKAGIWYMPMKGSILKGYYPKIGMRQMADNDILIDAHRAEHVRDIMESLSYLTEHFGKGAHDSYFKEPVCNFEMHRALFAPAAGEALFEYYLNVKDLLVKDDGNAYGYHFTDEDFYIYITAHEYKHYSNSGTGLRSILDTYVYLKRFENKLNWKYIAGELVKLGIDGFERQNRSLALHLFSGQELTSEDESMLQYIIGSGTYGNRHNYVDNQIKKLGGGRRGKLIYLKNRVFLPMQSVESGYPFFYRHSDNFPSRATESCPSHGQKNVDLTDNDLSGNKNENIKMIHQKEEINNPRKVYGRYENVSLSDMEYDQLRKEYSHIDEIIDRVSEEMAMYGKTYRNYEAAIRLWISRHRDEYITMSYYARPGESL